MSVSVAPSIRLPQVVGSPCTQITSLIATGTPSSGPDWLSGHPPLVDRPGLLQHALAIEMDKHVQPAETVCSFEK